MTEFFGISAGVLTFLAALTYIRDILSGKVQPQRTSFLIWTVLGLIAATSQFADGASWSLILPISDSAVVFCIFILAMRHGVGGWNFADRLSISSAGLGLVLWYITDQPVAALLITIMIDASATVLTLIKTWKEPASETILPWALAGASGLSAALAVCAFDITLLFYPLYIFIANCSVVFVFIFRRSTA